MFISLNRKIIYSIIFLFLVTLLIFVYNFYNVYGNKILEDQRYNIQRNQQYVDLLAKNIYLKSELTQLIRDNPTIVPGPYLSRIEAQEPDADQISFDMQQIREINRSFDERYQAVAESIKIILISSAILVIAISLLGYLITRWILRPVSRIAEVSSEVAAGNLKQRIARAGAPRFTDELDNLTVTFNQMLDNLEEVLSEIKEKEAFLQALINNIPDGIRVIDDKGEIIIANKAYFRQGSLPSSNLSVNSAQLQLAPDKNYTVESIRDLSEDINFSHQQKLSSLGFLSTSIAHEMKNNLGALRIIFELLLQKHGAELAQNPPLNQQLDLIYQEMLHCMDVPERLLKLTRNSERETKAFDCGASLRDVASLMDYEAKSKGVSIDLQLPEKLQPVSGSETDFKMIAINLILNAIQASEAGGSLIIRGRQISPRRIQIDFSDQGCGIAAEKLEKIFEPFYSERAGSTGRGNGLGLSIVRSLTAKMGGRITVCSKAGKGSCFSLILPVTKNLAKK